MPEATSQRRVAILTQYKGFATPGLLTLPYVSSRRSLDIRQCGPLRCACRVASSCRHDTGPRAAMAWISINIPCFNSPVGTIARAGR